MDIRSALGRLAEIQNGLAIEDPYPESVKRVFKYHPDRKKALADLPCWMNTFTLTDVRRGPDGRIVFYTVRSQLAIGDANLDVGADMAAAFLGAYMDALDADVKLHGTVREHKLRGGDPTLVLLEWAGQTYIGLDVYEDLILHDGKSFS